MSYYGQVSEMAWPEVAWPGLTSNSDSLQSVRLVVKNKVSGYASDLHAVLAE